MSFPAAQRIHHLAEQAWEPVALASTFERLRGSLPTEPSESLLEMLAILLQASDFLPRFLIARPKLIRWLERLDDLNWQKPKEQYRSEIAAAARRVSPGDETALYRRLRHYKYRELLRLMARDLVVRAPMDQLGSEMSYLAEALVAAALEWADGTLRLRYGTPDPPGFCVLGLGKLGGEDLNFSSDIDLVYVYRGEGQTSGGSSGSLSSVQFFTKLGEALTRALSTTTAEGFCFRVDLNLRPQGRSGAITHSLAATANYYEAHGRAWERAALLKARLVAGDEALGGEVFELLNPFVWRRHLDLTAVDELRKLKSQIDLRSKASTRDIKLGPGGIREIEFFINALQLVHGGKNPALRERNTLRALRKLEKEGAIAAPDADALEEAYLFLRRIENRLQMVEERQTHQLPDSEKERTRLARLLGLGNWDRLEGELRRHREIVASSFSRLLGQTVRDDVPTDPMFALALDVDAPDEQRAGALSERGFAFPDRAIAALDRLSKVEESQFGQTPQAPEIPAVKLLVELARTPDPDQALFHFCDFISRLRSPGSYLNLLAEAPQVRRRLLNLFGQSDFLSRYFLRHPELLDALMQSGLVEIHKEPARIRQELAQRLVRSSELEERLAALRRFKNEEVLRIGLNDIAGELSVPEVTAQLTAIADASLEEVLFLAENEQRARYGEPRNKAGAVETLAVVGMGKLGGRELGYHSDLDLLFVYSGEGSGETTGGTRGRLSHHEYFAKTAQRLLHFMQIQLREGDLYKVDARLRPSGNKGTLVVSQAAFHEHHERRAQLWERQALIKARGVAGDISLFERLERETIEPLVYGRPLPADAAVEVDRLRQRMEHEIAHEGESELNLKTGHGGLVDVEFATQYLQLAFGGRLSSLRTQATLEALSALEREGCLPPADAASLREAYLFYRRVENRLRLVHGYPLARLPTKGRALALLARRLGYLGPEASAAFMKDYRFQTARVRQVYSRALQLTN